MKDISESKILICDDSITNVLILESLLKSEGYTSVTALTEPEKILHQLESFSYDLLLLDIEMPVLSGFDVLEQIAASSVAIQMIPVLILTGSQAEGVRNRALAGGAQDFVNKPFDQTEVLLRVRNLLKVRAAYTFQEETAQALEKKVAERTHELNTATDFLITRLAMAGELRDTNTGKHVLRVGQFSRILAEAYGLPTDISFLIEKAAPLHDLGKIGIPDSILLKPGRLDKAERTLMDEHAQMGARLLSHHESTLVKMAATIALTHHECWDGSGYPAHLSGESIPIEGRITAISDVFDALTTIRPYKAAWNVEDALELLKEKSGTQFDPTLVKLFEENLVQILDVKESYKDSGNELRMA